MARWWFGPLVAATGCAAPTFSDCFGGSEGVDATVTFVDGVPVFDWEPGTAYAVTVEVDGRPGRTLWHAQCGGDNLSDDHALEQVVCLDTPLVYGEPGDSPDLDHVNTSRARPLEPGVTYRVLLNTMIEGDGPEPPAEEGSLADAFDWLPEPDRDDPHCGRAFASEATFRLP